MKNLRLVLSTLASMFLLINTAHAGTGFSVTYYGDRNTKQQNADDDTLISNNSNKDSQIENSSSNTPEPSKKVGRNMQYILDLESANDKYRADVQRITASEYRTYQKPWIHHVSNFKKDKSAYDDIIEDAAKRHGIDKNLVKAIMHTESSFSKNVISPKGAVGLMQLIPSTARRFNVKDITDPVENIEGGVKYLKWLEGYFNGDTRLMLAGYNAGEGAVIKYGGVPPYKETRDYIKRVLTRYNNLYSN